jgi:hypothetical protein
MYKCVIINDLQSKTNYQIIFQLKLYVNFTITE